MTLPESAQELIRAGALGHLVTSNPDGTPQVTCVWVAVERVGGIGPWAS